MPIQNIFFFGNYLTFFTYFVTIKIHMKYSKVLYYLLGEKIWVVVLQNCLKTTTCIGLQAEQIFSVNI